LRTPYQKFCIGAKGQKIFVSVFGGSFASTCEQEKCFSRTTNTVLKTFGAVSEQGSSLAKLLRFEQGICPSIPHDVAEMDFQQAYLDMLQLSCFHDFLSIAPH
jgi:hypothetical protein